MIFGEPRTADVRAKTYCEVAMLRKGDLDEVLVNFPLIERFVSFVDLFKSKSSLIFCIEMRIGVWSSMV